jgi:lysozyme family protein
MNTQLFDFICSHGTGYPAERYQKATIPTPKMAQDGAIAKILKAGALRMLRAFPKKWRET